MWALLPFASSPEHRLPLIQFLFIGSRVCSTLPSDLASRLGPCASLSLHVHHVVKRTFTSKLSIMLGTQSERRSLWSAFRGRPIWVNGLEGHLPAKDETTTPQARRIHIGIVPSTRVGEVVGKCPAVGQIEVVDKRIRHSQETVIEQIVGPRFNAKRHSFSELEALAQSEIHCVYGVSAVTRVTSYVAIGRLEELRGDVVVIDPPYGTSRRRSAGIVIDKAAVGESRISASSNHIDRCRRIARKRPAGRSWGEKSAVKARLAGATYASELSRRPELSAGIPPRSARLISSKNSTEEAFLALEERK